MKNIVSKACYFVYVMLSSYLYLPCLLEMFYLKILSMITFIDTCSCPAIYNKLIVVLAISNVSGPNKTLFFYWIKVCHTLRAFDCIIIRWFNLMPFIISYKKVSLVKINIFLNLEDSLSTIW